VDGPSANFSWDEEGFRPEKSFVRPLGPFILDLENLEASMAGRTAHPALKIIK